MGSRPFFLRLVLLCELPSHRMSLKLLLCPILLILVSQHIDYTGDDRASFLPFQNTRCRLPRTLVALIPQLKSRAWIVARLSTMIKYKIRPQRKRRKPDDIVQVMFKFYPLQLGGSLFWFRVDAMLNSDANKNIHGSWYTKNTEYLGVDNDAARSIEDYQGAD